MDPNACADRIIGALHAHNESDAIEAMLDLVDWLATGGFPPTADRLAEIRAQGVRYLDDCGY